MGFQLQVRGEWAGSFGTWRPAVDGTLNQSALTAEDASTFDSIDDARAFLAAAILSSFTVDPDGDPRDNAPRFRIVDLDTGDKFVGG